MTIFEVKNLGLKAGDKEILRQVYFEVREGDRLALVGPSGSGKSTILKILASLTTPTSGQVFYRGKDLEELDPITYRQEVTYCYQQPVLFGDRVRDNLEFVFRIHGENLDEGKVIQALKEVNLSEDYLDLEVAKLSGGEKQRVALIRNLMFGPKVLLLDEVTTGLDKDNKEIVRQFINRQAATIIEVSHDLEEIERSRNVLTIEEGQVV